MAEAPVIHETLHGYWWQVRAERAALRRVLHEEINSFWKQFPRRRKRVMPVASYTGVGTWFEPAPVLNDGPFPDRLGFRLRWRMSGVVPLTVGGVRRLRQVWDYEWSKDCPAESMIKAGGIATPEAIQSYQDAFGAIASMYRRYLDVGDHFERIARELATHDKGRKAVPRAHEVERIRETCQPPHAGKMEDRSSRPQLSAGGQASWSLAIDRTTPPQRSEMGNHAVLAGLGKSSRESCDVVVKSRAVAALHRPSILQ